MEFRNVTLKTSLEETEKVKITFKYVDELYPDMILTPFKYGKLGDEIVITFKVDEKHLKPLLRILNSNNFTIMVLDEATKTALHELNISKAPTAPLIPEDWQDAKNKIKDVANEALHKLISEGNYREVIKISKNLRAERSLVTGAANNITNTVFKAVEIIKNQYKKKNLEPHACINRIIEIAHDKVLKDLRKDDILKYCGFEAINMCVLNKDTIRLLIKISNDNTLYHLVNLKAAIKFSEIVLNNPNSYQEELKDAIKNLNVKWLYLTYDVYKYELDENEKESLEKLVDLVYTERSKSQPTS
ncbi:MAG: hypothetical protein V1720_21605 [bacterium]